ncbi:hypothetical protein PMEL_200001 [Prevotella melaninogenica]|uniref:Uncharacterized protein n=1 Tax=Prevotella melaninogenica TaxID=28132 RepID=A0A250KIH6_9BACT|nr:hypothetical protein PMEL_200001 [Prevotella melaninogenica]
MYFNLLLARIIPAWLTQINNYVYFGVLSKIVLYNLFSSHTSQSKSQLGL